MLSGDDVFGRLPFLPCEVAEYHQVMIYGGYKHKILEAEGIIVEA